MSDSGIYVLDRDDEGRPLEVEMRFPIVTEAGFPGGLRCCRCQRIIEVGQPYTRHLQSVFDDGATIGLLTCVYCPDTP